MARKVITMEQKLAAVLVREAAGYAVSVTEVCANLQISRQTYYRYRRRFQAEGLEGLAPRSRRPLTTPTLTDPATVELIVRARKELAEEGWDNGAISVRSRLLSQGVSAPPAARTVHRVLVRAGLVDPEPRKRPRSSYRRFQFPATDDCWQIDAFEYHLAGGVQVVVFELLDDHSRYQVGNLAWPKEDTIGAWKCLSTAINHYGKPGMLLSDNGLAFSGKRIGSVVLVEKNLLALGIKPITSRPYHPQTNGKNERGHRTARKWLARQPLAADLAQLQEQLDTYRQAYNHTRPHQALDGDTPAVRRLAGTRHSPARTGPAPEPVPIVTDTTADNRGVIGVHGARIGLGLEYAGLPITVFNTGGHVTLFYRHHLVRELTLDPTKRHQKPSRAPGNTRAPRRTVPTT
jgi:transposase InsO family protein